MDINCIHEWIPIGYSLGNSDFKTKYKWCSQCGCLGKPSRVNVGEMHLYIPYVYSGKTDNDVQTYKDINLLDKLFS